MTIDLREVVDFITSQPPCDDIGEKVAARWQLDVGDLDKVITLLRVRAEEAMQEGAVLRRIHGIAARGNPSADETLETTLRRLAGVGDREAAAALAEITSPTTLAQHAVMDAAVGRHSDWRRSSDGRGWIGPKADDHPQADPEKLVTWFEQNWPDEAAKITAEAMAR
jgi:hypothetical protein